MNGANQRRLRGVSLPSLLLGGAVLLCTSLLALGHLATRDSIQAREAEDLIASLDQVLPAARRDNDLLASVRAWPLPDGGQRLIYSATQAGEIRGLAYRVTAPDGYGGPIQLLLGVAPDGRVLGVRVLAHSETPGLGDKIDVLKSDWIRDFDGRSLNDPASDGWAVKKDGGRFDQFTGATVTPRAVVSAVHQGLLFFHQGRAALLEPTGITQGTAENRAEPTPEGAGS
ncbi:electron transport complex subunit RsxG [Motiliproteus sp. SC1-56]|uniref:electron transport complex subunit RsxG n=1 Tax=Motiliproteus sp. SC1-56 TaxID=2799565 RepID=UPI001A900F54|nr:electron transport complex subunit RsxG [Motiliproteus sp. SC1-56]